MNKQIKYSLILFLLVVGCRKARPVGPPDIEWGKDTCSRCGMIISEKRYAGGYVDDSGDSVIYDDLGELFQAAKGRADLLPKIYVSVSEDAQWLPASKAYFVHIQNFPTPMGYGRVAFSDSAQGLQFAKKKKILKQGGWARMTGGVE